MVSTRTVSWLSTLALVLGALLVGDALNGAFVADRFPVTAPAAVFRGLGGVVLIGIGARFRTAPEYVPRSDDRARDDSGPAVGDDEFDPDLSPLGDAEPGRTDGKEASGRADTTGVEGAEAEVDANAGSDVETANGCDANGDTDS